MAAKPIIDILMIVPSLTSPDATIARFAALEYVFWKDNPKKDRLFFVKGMPPFGAQRTHHVHVTEPDGELVERLLFRDYLRHHTLEADQYAALKRHLAAKFPVDREAYTDAKSDFVAEIMKRARSAALHDLSTRQ